MKKKRKSKSRWTVYHIYEPTQSMELLTEVEAVRGQVGQVRQSCSPQPIVIISIVIGTGRTGQAVLQPIVIISIVSHDSYCTVRVRLVLCIFC